MKKKLVSVLLATTVMASFIGCGSKKEATTGGEKEKLVMATNAEFPPYEYREGDKFVGIDIEIADAIAKDLGMELEIDNIEFDAIITCVSTGKADMALAGLTVTEERKKNVDFTDTYANSTQVMIVKEDSTIASKEDLKGKIVGVQTGTTGDLYVSEETEVTVERYNKGLDAVMAMSQGKIDAVVIDREPAKVFVEENKGIKIVDKEYTKEDYAIAVKKGNTELLNKINASLKKLKENGELQKIIDKYITQ